MPVPRTEPPRRAERVAIILERLAREQAIDAHGLARELGVSTATMRRDLQLLADQQLLSRTHGGAIALDVAYRVPLRYRTTARLEDKRSIARVAAALLPDGPLAVGLSGGTTTGQVAQVLAERGDITLVTNSLGIAMDLVPRPGVKLILTGGQARPQSYELVGPLADLTLQGLHLEVAIVGVDGINARAGLTTHDPVEADTDRMIMSRAQRVIVVADGSKVGRTLLARMCPLGDVDDVVTDDSASRQELAALTAAGIRVHVVQSATRAA